MDRGGKAGGPAVRGHQSGTRPSPVGGPAALAA